MSQLPGSDLSPTLQNQKIKLTPCAPMEWTKPPPLTCNHRTKRKISAAWKRPFSPLHFKAKPFDKTAALRFQLISNHFSIKQPVADVILYTAAPFYEYYILYRGNGIYFDRFLSALKNRLMKPYN